MTDRKSKRSAKKTLPVALLVEGRKCLVVGGGAVAGRKAEALLDAGAIVTLVAPETSDRVSELRRRKGMTVVRRRYVPDDLEGVPFLVLTVTNDHALNRRIIETCRQRGILCACPDQGWEHGDFISPAGFRHGDLTVSVSTGGASCRRSRLIKDSLARHAAAFDRADLLVMGTDQRHMNLAVRESLHLTGESLIATSESLFQMLGIHEFMLLNTCNRIELVALATSDPMLLSVAAKIIGLDRPDNCFYTHRGYDAFRHLAFVAAGLFSQTPGETHVRAQLKEALGLSRRKGWSAAVLQDWMGRALRIGNVIREGTTGILERTEIENRCAAFLGDALGCLRERRVLVVGTGVVGLNTVKALRTGGAVVSCCYFNRPPVFEDGHDAVPALPFKKLRRILPEQDAVVCAVAADKPVLAFEQSGWIPPGRPLIVADLGVPRNVAPEFGAGRPEIKTANLDELDKWDRSHEDRLSKALEIADRIVGEHTEDYERIVSGI